MAKAAQTGTNSEAGDGASVATVSEIKEIPLGMSADEMKVSNANVVLSIEDAGKKAGADDERKRIAALQAAFPNDPDFVKEATEKGLSVNDAKAAKFDAVTAQNAELTAKNEELTKKVAAKDPNIEFAASDKDGGAVSTSDTLTVDEMDAKSVEIWNKNANLRANFFGGKSAFQALYRNDAEMAEQVAKEASEKK